jgi:hypothetical protein
LPSPSESEEIDIWIAADLPRFFTASRIVGLRNALDTTAVAVRSITQPDSEIVATIYSFQKRKHSAARANLGGGRWAIELVLYLYLQSPV